LGERGVGENGSNQLGEKRGRSWGGSGCESRPCGVNEELGNEETEKNAISIRKGKNGEALGSVVQL